MTQRNTFPRLLLTVLLLTAVCAGLFAPSAKEVDAKPNNSGTMQIIINEIAWSGTQANINAEWIELYNPSASAVNLAGWTLQATDGTPNILLTGTIPANGYYLLERTADTTVNDVAADQIYTGALSNAVENLELRDASSALIDTANEGGLAWYAGSVIGFYSMERRGFVADGSSSWLSNNGIIRNGLDSGGNPINGTPKQINGAAIPTATPTFTNTSTSTNTPTNTLTPTFTPIFSLTPSLTPAPGEVIISEVAWSGTIATTNDEWIELYNTRSTPIDITGWRLVSDSGSVDIVLNGVINGNSFFLLERARELTVSDVSSNQIYTGALSDAGEILRLSKPNGVVIDTANSDGGSWPAGTASTTFYSMERLVNGSVIAPDTSSGWVSNNQPISWVTHDADNNLIHGTPGLPNFNFVSTLTPTSTATATPTRTITPTSSQTRSVIINEIAWAGTASGLSDDEWIELYNPGSTPINITGWRITASDGTPNITLVGAIPAGGYFLLEKDDDNTVRNILADQIYTGNAMSNSGESLTLYDASNKIIDRANSNGGSWPAGSSSTYGTMERISGTADSDSAWHTNTGAKINGTNANNGNILGTPKNGNSPGPTPTPSRTNTPTRTPTPFPIDARPIINEILARPGFDWNQDGRVDVFDEFIEIKNLTAIDITLNGWKLNTVNGNKTFSLPNVTLKPNERIVFYSLETNLLLSDGGETVRLINSSGKIYDAYTYTVAKAEDKSFCRLPDGNVYNGWFDDCLPTPSQSNTREGNVPTSPDDNESSVCNLPDTIPADFFFAECKGYGKNIWNPFYWGELYRMFIKSNTTKWETFFE